MLESDVQCCSSEALFLLPLAQVQAFDLHDHGADICHGHGSCKASVAGLRLLVTTQYLESKSLSPCFETL